MIYIYIALGIAVLAITILALIGLNVKKQERKIRKQLGLEDTTSPKELEKAIKRFKRKQFMTKKEVRDEWLKSKGYSVRFTKKEKDQLKITREKKKLREKPLSDFQSKVRTFMKLKYEDKIEIYSALKNKYGIPYYEIRKTLGEQIRGIK